MKIMNQFFNGNLNQLAETWIDILIDTLKIIWIFIVYFVQTGKGEALAFLCETGNEMQYKHIMLNLKEN